MAWLWKDHTGARRGRRDHRPLAATACGRSTWPNAAAPTPANGSGARSCALRRTAPDVFAAAHSFVEHCDFIPAVLAGDTSRKPWRGVCAAGHKAMYNADWGGLPDAEFLAMLDPGLAACATASTRTRPSRPTAAGG
jgi:L-ribulokinase